MQNDANGHPGQQSNLNSSIHPGEKFYQDGLDAYWGRNNTTKNKKKAFIAFQQAANKNHLKGKTYLAICYVQGKGINVDQPLGYKLLQDLKLSLEKLTLENDREAQIV